jgi:hypothetical protein
VAGNQVRTAKNGPTRKTKRPYLREVLKEQGRSYVWLARTTGYSETQINRVANGHHPGTQKFWRLMSHALGEELTR